MIWIQILWFYDFSIPMILVADSSKEKRLCPSARHVWVEKCRNAYTYFSLPFPPSFWGSFLPSIFYHSLLPPFASFCHSFPRSLFPYSILSSFRSSLSLFLPSVMLSCSNFLLTPFLPSAICSFSYSHLRTILNTITFCHLSSAILSL